MNSENEKAMNDLYDLILRIGRDLSNELRSIRVRLAAISLQLDGAALDDLDEHESDDE